jgi:hypothetical protein
MKEFYPKGKLFSVELLINYYIEGARITQRTKASILWIITMMTR